MKRSIIAITTAFVLMFSQLTGTAAGADQAITLQPVSGVNLSEMGNGLKGSYFGDRELNSFKQYRIDKYVNFNWGNSTRPVSAVKHDNFSVRWTGYLVPTFTEEYKLRVLSDDGVRVYLNDTLLINDWTTHGEKENIANVKLTAGQPYSIKVEYFQYNGPASVKLYWSSYSQRSELIPENHLYTPKVETAKRGTGTGLIGSYYSGKSFDKLTKTRLDDNIDFNWSKSDVSRDGVMSVRWVGRVQPQFTDTYTFKTQSDDGVRLWVNNQLLIDNWKDMSATESVGKIQLQAGKLYDIKLEYYNNGVWPAVMKLYWSCSYMPEELINHHQLYKPEAPKPGTGTGLTANYFADKALTLLKATKVDQDINFDWGNRGLPVDGVAHNGFSVRWTGKLLSQYNEFYTIKTVSDDGIRLWVNGKLLIDQWNNHSAKTDTARIDLQAGAMNDIKIEYYQENGNARCELYWSSESQKQEIVPQTQLYAN